MKLDLLNIENKKTDVQISETTFGKEFNETLFIKQLLPI